MTGISMNERIFNVVCAVKAQRGFIYADAIARGLSHNDIDALNQQYYNSLPLPEGMKKNRDDYNATIAFGLSREFDEAYRTEVDDLGKFVWKNW